MYATVRRVCVSLGPCDLACSKHVPAAINYFLLDFDGSDSYGMMGPYCHMNGNHTHTISTDCEAISFAVWRLTHCIGWAKSTSR